MLTNLLFEKIESEEGSAVQYKQRSCLRSRYNKNDCRACLDECRAGALKLNGRTVSFNADKCSGCMRCTAVCPNDAFTTNIDMLALLKKIKTQKQVVLSCMSSGQFVSHEKINCIGVFSEPLLASMNLLAKGKVFLDVTQCNSCDNGHCLESIKNVLSLFRAYENETDSSLKIKLLFDEGQFPEMDAKQSRRHFLKDSGKAIADLGIESYSKAIGKTDSAIKEPRKGPVKSSLILKFAINNLSDDQQIRKLERYFYSVEADETCNLCPVCSGMCPTGALKRVTENNDKHLVFKSADCSGCGLCRDFCKKQALTIEKDFSGSLKESRQLN